MQQQRRKADGTGAVLSNESAERVRREHVEPIAPDSMAVFVDGVIEIGVRQQAAIRRPPASRMHSGDELRIPPGRWPNDFFSWAMHQLPRRAPQYHATI